MARSADTNKKPFIVGNPYTRNDVYDALGIPDGDRGGKWNTGYTKHAGEIYVFCNVGVPGRTGHDYQNRWEGDELVWFGKGGTRLTQSFIKEMISGDCRVHFFWRSAQYSPFTYAGWPDFITEIKDTSPVEVRWGGFGGYPMIRGRARLSITRNVSTSDDLYDPITRMATAIVQRVAMSQKTTTIKRPLRTGPQFKELVTALRKLWVRQDGKCALCGRAIPLLPANRLMQMSPDRINSRAKTYLSRNVHIVHLGCNLAKSDASMSDWTEFLQMLRDPVPV